MNSYVTTRFIRLRLKAKKKKSKTLHIPAFWYLLRWFFEAWLETPSEVCMMDTFFLCIPSQCYIYILQQTHAKSILMIVSDPTFDSVSKSLWLHSTQANWSLRTDFCKQNPSLSLPFDWQSIITRRLIKMLSLPLWLAPGDWGWDRTPGWWTDGELVQSPRPQDLSDRTYSLTSFACPTHSLEAASRSTNTESTLHLFFSQTKLSLRFLEKRSNRDSKPWYQTAEEDVIWERWEIGFTIHPQTSQSSTARQMERGMYGKATCRSFSWNDFKKF